MVDPNASSEDYILEVNRENSYKTLIQESQKSISALHNSNFRGLEGFGRRALEFLFNVPNLHFLRIIKVTPQT